MAVHSLIRVEILSSACVNSLEFAEMRFKNEFAKICSVVGF